MFPHRGITGFVLRVLVFYGLLIAPWPGSKEAYSAIYRAAGDFLFASFGPGGVVRFQSRPDGPAGTDIGIFLRKPPSRAGWRIPHHSWYAGYLPTAEALALILATPIPWSRRWKALVWGMLLVNGFVAFRLWITLLDGFSGDEAWSVYAPGPFWSQVLGGVHHVVVMTPTFPFVVPALIWILVSFRRSDLLTMMPTPGGVAKPSARSKGS